MKVKKLLALILAFAMIMSTISFAAYAEENGSVSTWDGTSYSLEWLKDGNPEATDGDVFHLESAEDLAGLAYYVNNYASTNNIFTGDIVYLDVDVDLNNHPWAPIGTALPREKNRFYGSFIGSDDGHTISNLNVEEGHYYAGLFGQIPTYNYTQTFSNITINNVHAVAEDETESTKNKEGAGALMGRANGSIISGVNVTGEINISGDRFVGGITGHSYARISDCAVTASGTINAVTWQAGGIAGAHGATDTYTASASNCIVNGGEDGLAITSYYASVGGAFGSVSLTKVDSTTIDNINVSNVSLSASSDAYGSGLAAVASGYNKTTNSIAVDVDVKLAGETQKPADADTTVAVAEVNGVYFTNFADATKSIMADGGTLNLLSDVVIDGVWDQRQVAQFKAPVVINGNENTITVTGHINDGQNHHALFRALSDITINDLTVDLSAATSANDTRMRVLSTSAGNVSINNCEFIGNPEYTNTRGIIFGEGAGEAVGNITVSVTNSAFENWRRGLGDNENAQDVKSVTATGNTFTNADVLLSAAEDVTFTDNTMDGGYVSITSYAPVTKLNVVATGNTLEEEANGKKNTILADTIVSQEGFGLPVAEVVGGKKYASVAEAIKSAADNDVVIIAPGEYDFDNKIVINKSVTITGDPNYGSATLTASAGSLTKPVINITDVTNGGVEYHAPNVVFDNLVFNVEEDAVCNGWNVSAIGYYYEIVADREGLTVTNCDFINNSPISMSAIAANIANYTVTGNTFKNFTTMVHSFVDHGPLGTVVVADNTYANVDNIVNVYWGVDDGNTASISVTDNKSTDGEIAKIAIDNFGMTKATPVVAIDSAIITGNDAEIIYQNYTKATALNTDEEVVYTYKNEGTAAIGAASGVTGYVYTNYGSADEKVLYLNNGVVAGTPEIIRVLFDNITPVDDKGNYTVEGERTYNINLKVSDAEIINRLNSADLTFEINTTKGDIAYEIIASNDEVEINPVYNPADGSVIEGRYEFHYAGKDNVKTDTDTLITIGKVKFTGYGEFTFAVDKDSMTNAAHTTTLQDNIVETYFPAGDITKGEGKLDIDGAKFNENIEIAKRNLVINVAFPNAIEANSKDYQDMTITVTGPEGYKTVIDLADGNDGENLQTAANGDVYYSTDDANTAAVEGLDLTLNTPYTVTVEGAGYRTVKYTVNMTEDKTLNFWNNVKDNAKAVEVSESGVEKYAQTVTFLAGDIVKDNDINVYDLSAVVSYFGEIDLDENNKPEYAKYDLNRDGKIDSKDVAYVLVSWGN